MIDQVEGTDPIRGLVEFLNTVLRMEVDAWGDPVDAILMRTVHLGETEGRLYDITSLASVTAMTVPTTARRVTDLMARGLIRRHRDGRSYRLTLTDDSRNRLCGTFDRLSQAAHQVLVDLDTAPGNGDCDPAPGCDLTLETPAATRAPQLA